MTTTDMDHIAIVAEAAGESAASIAARNSQKTGEDLDSIAKEVAYRVSTSVAEHLASDKVLAANLMGKLVKDKSV